MTKSSIYSWSRWMQHVKWMRVGSSNIRSRRLIMVGSEWNEKKRLHMRWWFLFVCLNFYGKNKTNNKKRIVSTTSNKISFPLRLLKHPQSTINDSRNVSIWPSVSLLFSVSNIFDPNESPNIYRFEQWTKFVFYPFIFSHCADWNVCWVDASFQLST